jgi:Fe-S-cluster containining protein
MARRSDIDAQLDALYARLPVIDCAGLCAESCGPIDMTFRERARIREHGQRITEPEKALARPGFRCDALTAAGRCGVYDVRPLICRLWGVTENMRCPWGCQPHPRHLTAVEANQLMTEAMLIGGHPAIGTHTAAEVEQANAAIAARAPRGLQRRGRGSAE